MKLKIYGSRGSVGFFSRSNVEYGGNTVCSALDIDGHIILLDCGTGLMQFYHDMKDRFKDGFKFDVLLSHLHLDHIIGFSTFGPILSPDSDIRIFTRSRGELPLVSQVFGVFQPPYWPIEIAEMTSAKVLEIAGEESFKLSDNIEVTSFWSEHHNETVGFRIDADKSLVYLLDYEINENSDKYEELIGFCKDADIAVFDSTYLPEDYPPRRGWGHSTFLDGIALAEASACKKMVFSHICQDYSDVALNAVKGKFDASKYSIAFDGMEIEI
jgi:ribonuclease BN (tRNA processing enzyme)